MAIGWVPLQVPQTPLLHGTEAPQRHPVRRRAVPRGKHQPAEDPLGSLKKLTWGMNIYQDGGLPSGNGIL